MAATALFGISNDAFVNNVVTGLQRYDPWVQERKMPYYEHYNPRDAMTNAEFFRHIPPKATWSKNMIKTAGGITGATLEAARTLLRPVTKVGEAAKALAGYMASSSGDPVDPSMIEDEPYEEKDLLERLRQDLEKARNQSEKSATDYQEEKRKGRLLQNELNIARQEKDRLQKDLSTAQGQVNKIRSETAKMEEDMKQTQITINAYKLIVDANKREQAKIQNALLQLKTENDAKNSVQIEELKQQLREVERDVQEKTELLFAAEERKSDQASMLHNARTRLHEEVQSVKDLMNLTMELQKENETHQIKYSELERQKLEEAQKAKDAYLDLLRQKESTVRNLEIANKKLQDAKEEADQKRFEKETLMEDLKSSMESGTLASSETIQDLRERIAQKDKELAQLEIRMSTADREAEDLRYKLAMQRKQTEEELRAAAEAREKAEGERDEANRRITKMESDVDQLDARIHELMLAADENRREIASFEALAKEQQTKVEALELERDRLKADLDAAPISEEVDKQMEEKEVIIQREKNKVAALRAKIANTRARKDSVDEEVRQLQKEKTSLSADLNIALQEKGAEALARMQLETVLSEEKEANASLQQEVKRLTRERDAAQANMKDIASASDETKAELKRIQQELSKQMEAVSRLKSDKTKLEDKLKLAPKNKDVNRQLQEKESEIQEHVERALAWESKFEATLEEKERLDEQLKVERRRAEALMVDLDNAKKQSREDEKRRYDQDQRFQKQKDLVASLQAQLSSMQSMRDAAQKRLAEAESASVFKDKELSNNQKIADDHRHQIEVLKMEKEQLKDLLKKAPNSKQVNKDLKAKDKEIENLISKLKASETKLFQSLMQKKEIEDRASQSQKKIDELSRNISGVTKQLEQEKQARSSSQAEVYALSAQVDRVTRERTAAHENQTALFQDLEKTRKQMAAAREDLTKKEGQITELNSKLEDLKKRLDAAPTSKAIKRQTDELQAKIETERQNAVRIGDELQTARSRETALGRQLQESEARVKTLSASLQQATMALEREKEDANKTIAARAAQSEGRIKEMSRIMSNVEKQLEQEREARSASQTDVSALRSQIDVMQKERTAAQLNQTALFDDLQGARKQMTDVRAELVRKEGSITDLQLKLAEVTKMLQAAPTSEAMQRLTNQLQAQISAEQQTADRIGKQLQNAIERETALSSQLHEAQTRIDTLTSALSEATETLEKEKSEGRRRFEELDTRYQEEKQVAGQRKAELEEYERTTDELRKRIAETARIMTAIKDSGADIVIAEDIQYQKGKIERIDEIQQQLIRMITESHRKTNDPMENYDSLRSELTTMLEGLERTKIDASNELKAKQDQMQAIVERERAAREAALSDVVKQYEDGARNDIRENADKLNQLTAMLDVAKRNATKLLRSVPYERSFDEMEGFVRSWFDSAQKELLLLVEDRNALPNETARRV
eukprot:jgi/Mesvir1/7785/Mv11728-RA.1